MGKLESVSGRIVDAFKVRRGTLIDSQYFTHLLYFRDWVRNFQVVQKGYGEIVFRIAGDRLRSSSTELDQISAKARAVMDSGCQVKFDFVDVLSPSPSGKFRYTMCEIP
jgi:phenylacetate-CoA ligase